VGLLWPCTCPCSISSVKWVNKRNLIAIEDQKLSKKLVFLNSIRIAIFLTLTLVSIIIWVFLNVHFSIIPVVIALVAAIAISILFFPLSSLLSIRPLLYCQLTFDILMITLLVYLSGGIISPFYFLYILPIIVAAIFLARRDTVIMATFSFISFGILSDLLYLGVIPYYPNIDAGEVSMGTFIYNLLMSFIAFAAISIMSSYYFERIRKTGNQLKSIQDNLQDMILLNNSVIEKMENGFITADTEGRIISYNAKAAHLLRLKKADNVFELLLIKTELPKIHKTWQDNTPYYFEKKLHKFDLGISVSQIKKVSTFENLIVFLITDLSAIKEIEKKLQEKEHLALIGGMAAGIAHEIRNPLASISGSVQFLRQELSLDNEIKNLMDIIVSESARLSAFIEEFLNFSKQMPMEIAEFDLAPLLDEVVGIISLNLRDVRFLKKYNREHWVVADIKKIRQLVWNLLNNAVKALNEKGEIEINLFRVAGTVHLSIKDFGVGMDSSEMQKIFIPFYSKFAFGIGLGMTIVKQIVDDHGFKMEIKSEKKLGTEVVICFSQP
jgi:two-component system sensor histidine kinase PilS (NtrC family)